MSFRKPKANGLENPSSFEEQQQKEEVAHEAETGKIYRTDYTDKYGRSVLVMRPGCQNTTSTKGQIRFLVYCMENAILNLPPDQEQIVWLIHYQGFNMSSISVKVARETAHVLQNRYPERLGLAILYDPPKFFEPFWTVVKPFLEPKTCRKVKFVYSDDPNSHKIMEEVFDMDKLECAFGGFNPASFNFKENGERMKEDDKKTALYWKGELGPGTSQPPSIGMPPPLESGDSELDSDGSVNMRSEEGCSHKGSSSKPHFDEDGSQENDEKFLENGIDLPESNSQENGVTDVANLQSHIPGLSLGSSTRNAA
ncbi:CRAL-TRIO domain-containing protein C23B6.04c isoform X2 [Amborella trichopoda]|uniref:CRAL-TRIO domain-containing protein C23B6.04c isoform X2 n=1 Tax=Amborella trichopoda TaxID=13333 RepID=UPI0005D320EC|nr:CRAL-TRIO domain-containing protein C23B6.04c isoform X2 [Amborella trichopoda]|eukprot:XP_011621427.1 CRAL-TRIO domain-containing protein C23B6.04c isoform X2 [Amborella trichopoda]